MPLNTQGEAQAKVVGRFLGGPAGVVFDEAWSSDLSRARKVSASRGGAGGHGVAPRWLLTGFWVLADGTVDLG